MKMIDDLLAQFRAFDSEVWIYNRKLPQAMEALVIANTTLIFGMIIYQFADPQLLFLLNTLGADISVITIAFIWISILSEPSGISLLILGWTIAGLYLRKRYNQDSPSILFRASAIPVIFILATLGILLLSLAVSVPIAIFLLVPVFLVLVMIFVVSAIFTVGGVIFSQVVSFDREFETVPSIERNYLILPMVPTQEEIEYCPFRKDNPAGCSYLGYDAANQPLICDYRSTYLRCSVYAHIVESMEAKNA